jgi:putative transposase
MPMLSFKYRLDETRKQRQEVDDMLGDFCWLYNSALHERIEAFRPTANARCQTVPGIWVDRKGKTREGYVREHLAKVPTDKARRVSYKSQALCLPKMRKELPDLSRWSATAEQQVLRKLDQAFAAFFGRCKEGKKPGYPRFKARSRYHSAMFRVGDGLCIKDGRITIVGVTGGIKVRWHRNLPSKPAAAILTRQCDKLYIVFQCEVEAGYCAEPLANTVGADVGLTALVALSDGDKRPRPNFTKAGSKKLRRQQRALARCKKGSKRRRKRAFTLAKHYRYIKTCRRDHGHKLARKIVDKFSGFAAEGMPVKGLAAGMLAKHVNDAAWRQLLSMMDYKAANAGKPFIYTEWRGSSQECICGRTVSKTLDERIHRCECGIVCDRDVMSANVLHLRAFGFLAWNSPLKSFQCEAAQ